MNIDTTIVDAYLKSEDMHTFSSTWLYASKMEHGEENLFQLPPEIDAKRETVSRIKSEIISHASTFTPCNARIWDALFDNWRSFLNDTTLDLIVGYPDPYDATVRQAPDGKYHMIFDLLCWEKYVGLLPLSALSQNLLTHELFHVMVENRFRDIEAAQAQGTYIERLDAITFNEGFAHLVSYSQQEIDTVPWNGEDLTEVYNRSAVKMKAALQESSHEKQKQYLHEADCGKYYEKYAAMCGMIYLGQQWQAGGIARLRELFYQGYSGFAAKSSGMNPNFQKQL